MADSGEAIETRSARAVPVPVQEPNPYLLLGIPPGETDPARIEAAAATCRMRGCCRCWVGLAPKRPEPSWKPSNMPAGRC